MTYLLSGIIYTKLNKILTAAPEWELSSGLEVWISI